MTATVPRWGDGADQSASIGTGRVPAQVYTDPGWWHLERERLFRATWLAVDSVDAVSAPGDFIVWERMGQSVIISRLADGSLAAFNNVCQHRGSRIAAEGGHCASGRLQCPFHGFTYDLEGTVVNVPNRDAFDPAQLEGLAAPPVAIDVWGGFIWVNFSPEEARPLQEYLGELTDELDWYGLDDWKNYGGNTWQVEGNWKLVLEGFLESWHTPFAHKKTVRGGFVTEQTTYSFFSPHSMMVVPLKRIDVAEAHSPVEHRAVADCHYLVFPNAFFNMFPDYGTLSTVYPNDQDSTTIQTWVIGRREAPEGQSYEEFDAGLVSSLRLMSRIVNEDLWISEEIASVRHSYGYTRNIFNTDESRLTAFQNEVAKFVQAG